MAHICSLRRLSWGTCLTCPSWRRARSFWRGRSRFETYKKARHDNRNLTSSVSIFFSLIHDVSCLYIAYISMLTLSERPDCAACAWRWRLRRWSKPLSGWRRGKRASRSCPRLRGSSKLVLGMHVWFDFDPAPPLWLNLFAKDVRIFISLGRYTLDNDALLPRTSMN